MSNLFSPLGGFFAGLCVCAVLTLIVIARAGVPGNAAAGVAVTLPVLLCLLAAILHQHSKKWMLWCGAFLIYLFLLIPPSSDYQSDLRNGRYALSIAPGFLFVERGETAHALIRKYLGLAPAVWKHACPGPGWTSVRDGNERVNSASILWTSKLPDVLEKLPDDAARTQVLKCLTDRNNLLRVHQSFLLTCLAVHGFPQNHTAASWWTRHAPIFRQEYNGDAAVRLTINWRERSLQFSPPGEQYWNDLDQQRYVLEQQESAGWGGDEAYRVAFEKLQGNGQYTPELGLDAVDWWKK